MGDRFYTQQLERTGWMPIANGEWVHKQRRRKMAWTDESKAQAVEMYQEQEPTPETSMEVVKDIADEHAKHQQREAQVADQQVVDEYQ